MNTSLTALVLGFSLFMQVGTAAPPEPDTKKYTVKYLHAEITEDNDLIIRAAIAKTGIEKVILARYLVQGFGKAQVHEKEELLELGKALSNINDKMDKITHDYNMVYRTEYTLVDTVYNGIDGSLDEVRLPKDIWNHPRFWRCDGIWKDTEKILTPQEVQIFGEHMQQLYSLYRQLLDVDGFKKKLAPKREVPIVDY